MPLLLEVLSQRFEIVDLAIEHDPYGAIFVMYRLVTAIEVDDTEAAHSDNRIRRHVVTVIIGPAMHHGIAHRLNFFLQRRFSTQAQKTCNSTHTGSPSNSRLARLASSSWRYASPPQ